MLLISSPNFYLPSTNGFLLVEHHHHYLDDKSRQKTPIIVTFAEGALATAAAGARITALNNDLAVLKTKELAIPELEDRLSAVMPDSSGGIFLGGCETWGTITVVHVDIGEHVDAKKAVSSNQCSGLSFARTQLDNEILLLVAEHDKIFPIKYFP